MADGEVPAFFCLALDSDAWLVAGLGARVAGEFEALASVLALALPLVLAEAFRISGALVPEAALKAPPGMNAGEFRAGCARNGIIA